MSPSERAIRRFRARYPLPREYRISTHREMSIRYEDLEALYAAPEMEARVVAPATEQPAESANLLPLLSAGGEHMPAQSAEESEAVFHPFRCLHSDDEKALQRANLALNAGIWCNGVALVVLALREVL